MRSFLTSCVVIGLGCGVLWQATDGLRAITTEGARRIDAMERPVHVPATRLTDMNGRAVTLTDGKVNVVEFIYATCPTICRTAGDDVARLRERLYPAADEAQVRLLSVSFDPARDGPEQLLSYADAHGADGRYWTVARPSENDLPALLDAFGVTVIADRFGGYEHNVAMHIVDRSGRIVRILDAGDIETAAATVEALLDVR